jgi:hypothetical protein
MSKNLDKLAELTAKRAGLLCEVRACEQDISLVCRCIAAESTSEGATPQEPKVRKSRTPKATTGVPSPSPSLEALDACDAESEARVDTEPPSAVVDEVEPPTLDLDTLQQMIEPGVPIGLSELGASLERQYALVNFGQPLVRAHVRELLHQLVEKGVVVKSGEKKGTVYTRVA